MKTDEEFIVVTDLVYQLLRDDIRCRNDDKYLTCRVMQVFLGQTGNLLTVDFNDFKKMPAFETVKRVRADWQNKKGVYLPTLPEVLNRRGLREMAIQKRYGSGKLF